MFDLIDVPSRILSYKKAGYTSDKARSMAYLDMQSAAEELLEQDYADPVSVLVDELVTEPLDTDNEVDLGRYETAEELHAVAATCRRHGVGMSDVNYRLGAAIMNSIHGKGPGEDVLVKLESIHSNGISPTELTIHFEDSVGQTLKNFWAKIRAKFIETFNKIKTWYIKTFDATKRLGAKAQALRTQAEGKQGTINNASFEMSGFKTLKINGKAPEPVAITQMSQKMSKISTLVLTKLPDGHNEIIGSLVDEMGRLIELAKSQHQNAGANDSSSGDSQTADFSSDPNDAKFSGADVNAVFGTVYKHQRNLDQEYAQVGMEPYAEASSDKRFSSFFAEDSAPVNVFKTRDVLPGDMMFVTTVTKEGDGGTSINDMNRLKYLFSGQVLPIKENPSEVDDKGTFKTLTTSHVITICDAVMEACKAGLDYKLDFQERDNLFKKLGPELDKTAKDAEDLKGTALTFVRSNISAVTSVFDKMNKLEGAWFRYSMGVYSKLINNYCQGSLNQIT